MVEVLIAAVAVLTVALTIFLLDAEKQKRHAQLEKDHKARMDSMKQFYQAKLNAELDEIDREYESKYGHPEKGEQNDQKVF